MIFLPATHPGIVAPRGAERLEGNALRVEGGGAGCVLWGPYARAHNGIYSVRARTRAVGGGGEDPLYLDVYADGRVYGACHFRDGCEVLVHLPDTEKLEFRFSTAEGVGLIHEGVELNAILLDRDPVSKAALETLILKAIESSSSPEPLFYLIERLARMGEPEAAEAWRSTFVAAHGRHMAHARAVWVLLNTPGTEIIPADLDFDLSAEQLVTLAAMTPLKGIESMPVNGQVWSPRLRDELAHYGYQLDFLLATAYERNLHRPRRSWQHGAVSESPSEFAPAPLMVESLRRLDLSFQEQIARGEGITAYCPVSGRKVRSTHGFCHHSQGLPQTLYRFEGVEVFYVLTGNFPNSRILVFMPRAGVYFLTEEPAIRHYDYEVIIREFIVKFLEHRFDVVHYLSKPTQPAAVLGLNNIGHFFWNELSGLQFIVDNNLHQSLAEIVTVPIQYIDYKALYPELSTVSSIDIAEPQQVFEHFVKKSLVPIRFTDARINQTLFERVRRVADACSSATSSPPPEAPRPLIWMNLRAQNKVWVSQAEGYANILNALREEYGSASALLQGMADCADLAAEVRRLTHPEVRLYDGMNLNIYEKLSWAGQVDAYICVAGAGLAFTTWLADQHGVAHSEHGHLDHLEWWPYVRPEAAHALAPPKSAVQELGVGWYCNYELDWRVVLDLVREALRAGGKRATRARKSSTPQTTSGETPVT